VGSLEFGSDFINLGEMNGGAFAGIRLLNVLELAAGARPLLTVTRDSDTHQRTTTMNWLAVARLQVHMDLDAARRVAIPFGFDVGLNALHARLNFGVRVRVTRTLYLGINPFNPTWTEYKKNSSGQQARRWTFPTNLELGFAF
jgi:hypothetical protein